MYHISLLFYSFDNLKVVKNSLLILISQNRLYIMGHKVEINFVCRLSAGHLPTRTRSTVSMRRWRSNWRTRPTWTSTSRTLTTTRNWTSQPGFDRSCRRRPATDWPPAPTTKSTSAAPLRTPCATSRRSRTTRTAPTPAGLSSTARTLTHRSVQTVNSLFCNCMEVE